MLATGTFDVTLSPLDHTMGTAEDRGVGRFGISKTFHGDLDAASRGEMLSSRNATKGAAGYVALENVTGTLLGKTGSFVLQHYGRMEPGSQSLLLEVVPGSGTEELASLTGSMEINIEDGVHHYRFEFALA